MNLGDLETFDLQIISGRWGPGLGGSGDPVVVIGFGFVVPYELHGRRVKDWGVDIAFTRKLISKSVLHSIKYSKMFLDNFKHGKYVPPRFIINKTFAQMAFLENLRGALHTLYVGLEVAKGQGVLVLEMPLGVGLQLSAYVTRGTMYVSNVSDWSESSRLF